MLAALLSAGSLGIGRALAASSAPVATATSVAYQPVIGNAISYEPNAGAVTWAASSDAQAPALALQGVAGSPWSLLIGAPADVAAATPAAAQTVAPASQSGVQVSVAATPQATVAATQVASRGAAVAHTQPAATQVARHGAVATSRRGHAASTADSLHLPGYVPISVPAPASLDGGSLLALGGKFLVVLVLLFVCLRVLRAVMPRMQGGAAGRGALVLFSESIGDKQRVCLLDLHVKLALVSISGGGVTPITTIDDPEQIAALRARYQARPSGRRQGPEHARPGLMRQRDRGGSPVDRGGLPVDRAGLTLKGHGRIPAGGGGPAPEGADEYARAASFASVLQQETGAAAAPAPTMKLPPMAAKGTAGGDMSFEQALATIRSLRQKVEQQ